MTDLLQQREALVEERRARGLVEEIEERGLCADVHGQLRVRVHARLRAARGSGGIVAAAPVCIREYIQVRRGVEIQEYGRRRDAPESGQPDVDLGDEVARDTHGRAGVRDVRAGGDGHLCGV